MSAQENASKCLLQQNQLIQCILAGNRSSKIRTIAGHTWQIHLDEMISVLLDIFVEMTDYPIWCESQLSLPVLLRVLGFFADIVHIDELVCLSSMSS
jgi:hypothetical protein